VLHYRAHVDGVGLEGDGLRHEIARTLIGNVLTAERNKLVELRLGGDITDVTYRRLQYDIDLEESLLA
jgi:hypothetical protein